MCAMWRLYCISLLFLILSGSAGAQLSVDTYTVALYRFDEQAGDSVHDAGPAQLHGSAVGATIVPGAWGNARRFNGSPDRVSVPPYNPAGPFSVEAFVRLDPPTGGEQAYPIVGHGVYEFHLRGYLLRVVTTSDGLSSVVFWANSETGDTTIFLADTRNASPPRYFTGFNEWHHIAGVWTGRTAQVFVDGELWHEVGGDSTTPIAANDALTLIGSDYVPGGLVHLTGVIDEVRISRVSSNRVPMQITPSWNLLAIPAIALDVPVDRFFPSAVSQAFAYTGTFVQRERLSNGIGYWLKFPAGEIVEVAGDSLTADSADVNSGWNIIGSLTVPLPAADVVSIPAGIISSVFYQFSPGTGYSRVDTLHPGGAYWVKTHSPGRVILRAPGANARELVNTPLRLPGEF